MSLTKIDYQNIVHFINDSLLDYRKIQALFSKLFQFDHSLLWYADKEGNMHNLKFYNFSEQLVLDYEEIHSTNDVMHPKKHLAKLGRSKETVYRIGEMATVKELSQSSYYPFIEHYEIIDQMVMYLSTAATVFAGIGFVRFEGEGVFTQNDKEVLQALSIHLQHLVVNSMLTREVATVSLLTNSNTEDKITLSSREMQVYQLLIRGYSNIKIANLLFITINTVKKHLRNMYVKYQVNSRTSLLYKLNSSAL